jgi:beta-glucosidase
MIKVLGAGVDQFGGESSPDVLVDIVRAGDLSEERLDVSARRLLREKFVLGLFDDPIVDVAAASHICGRADFRAAGEAAQREALVLLVNRPVDSGSPTLPLKRGLRLYVEGILPEVAAEYGEVVSDPGSAQVAILRLQAPYEERATAFENHFHAGSLDFAAEVVAHVVEIAHQVPTVVDVFLERPAILTPLVDHLAALVGNFGANPRALLDVCFGEAQARGRLPFDLPSSMAAVAASRPDVPFDTADPLFRFGDGLQP